MSPSRKESARKGRPKQRHNRPRLGGRLCQAEYGTAHKNHRHYPEPQGRAGAFRRIGARRKLGAGEPALLSAAGAHARDRRDPRSIARRASQQRRRQLFEHRLGDRCTAPPVKAAADKFGANDTPAQPPGSERGATIAKRKQLNWTRILLFLGWRNASRGPWGGNKLRKRPT
jgi:hypothetical protein